MKAFLNEFTTGLLWLFLVTGWWVMAIGGVIFAAQSSGLVAGGALVVALMCGFGAVIATWGIGVDIKAGATPSKSKGTPDLSRNTDSQEKVGG